MRHRQRLARMLLGKLVRHKVHHIHKVEHNRLVQLVIQLMLMLVHHQRKRRSAERIRTRLNIHIQLGAIAKLKDHKGHHQQVHRRINIIMALIHRMHHQMHLLIKLRLRMITFRRMLHLSPVTTVDR